ncbi:alpha/beta hydrolase [Spirillospora sp. NPDC127200]
MRSLVLSSAYPLAVDMWGRPNARAARRALRLVCQRSNGARDGDQVLRDIGRLAQRLRTRPIPYTLGGQRRLDDTALASIVYGLANTPTETGRQAARQFRRATVVEVPNVGHVPEHEPSGCVAAVQTGFIRGLRVPDTSCIREIPPAPVRS